MIESYEQLVEALLTQTKLKELKLYRRAYAGMYVELPNVRPGVWNKWKWEHIVGGTFRVGGRRRDTYAAMKKIGVPVITNPHDLTFSFSPITIAPGPLLDDLKRVNKGKTIKVTLRD